MLQVKKRLAENEKELSSAKISFEKLKNEWENEKKSLNEINQIKNEINKARFSLEKALNNGDYENASKLQYQKIPELEAKLSSAEEVFNSENKLISEVVDVEEIAKIVSKNTGR